LTYDKKYASPRQYVWVGRLDGTDQPMPEGADEVAEMSFRHFQFLQYLRVSLIQHPNCRTSPYLRWELNPDAGELSLAWKTLALNDEFRLQFERNKEDMIKRLHPVFVEAYNGLHFGRWAHDLCSRQNRVTALFVQAFGDR